jgi:hypothetical protein
MTPKLRCTMLVAVAALCLASAAVVLADQPSGRSGNSNSAHLYLQEKNPANWLPVAGGAWGKMVYTLSGKSFTFVFNGHKLDAGIPYTLIYYPDPWPGNGSICLGSGVADRTGDIHIKGIVNTGNLPIPGDLNGNAGTTTYGSQTGAKIWLVLSGDIGCSRHYMAGWHPTEYLFEMHLINYIETE